MEELSKQKLKKMFTSIYQKICNVEATKKLPKDFDENFVGIYDKSSKFTMTSPERMYALYTAVKYVSLNKIPGDIVECGVWKGGSSMISALTLINLEDTQRKLFLYDTYKGMTMPSENDRQDEVDKWKKQNKDEYNTWAYAPLEEVKINIFSTDYPKNQIFFIEGEVEKTIPKIIPEKISILRLDTDWYESTYHELIYMFPKLSKGGVLLIDDYGSKQGARRAVDKYFDESNTHPLLIRVDSTCRLLVKTND